MNKYYSGGFMMFVALLNIGFLCYADIPSLLCIDTVVTYPCDQHVSFYYSVEIPANYSGNLFNISFDQPQPFLLNVWGALPTIPDVNDLGGSCWQASSLVQNYTVTAPLGGLCIEGGGYYIFEILTIPLSSCSGLGVLTSSNQVFPNPCYDAPEEIPCFRCLPSFAPQPDSTYVVSAWVKEADAGANTVTYENAAINLFFPNTGITVGPFLAKGQIIDGWQRIDETFTVPHDATEINISLEHLGGAAVYFDDIRIGLLKAAMKAYVYDPITLKLSAELDERNYATMYEYDEEGILTRIKKETERGIMTLKENRTSLSK